MPTYEELLAAGATPDVAPPRAKGLTYEQLLAAGAEPAAPSASQPSRISALTGPGATAPDDVEFQPTEGPPGILRQAFPRATARTHAENPLEHDPLAAMIVQGIPAAGAGALLGGAVAPALSRFASGATTGALSSPDHPVAGALLGALPGIPGAVGAADNAIGRAALSRVTADKSLEAAGKLAGAGVGASAGHHAAGFVGAGLGAGVGAKVGAAAGRMADRGVGALADRYLARTAQFPAGAPSYTAPPFTASTLDRGPTFDADIIHAPPAPRVPLQLGPRTQLAPLAPEPRPLVAPPPGAFGEPTFDEFGVPLTRAGPPAANHATVGGATAARPRLQILDENGRDLLVPGDLRSDVMRDAQRFRGEPYSSEPGYQGYVSHEDVGVARPRVIYPNDKGATLGPSGKITATRWRGAGEAPDTTVRSALGDQLANSVRILDELRAGKITGQQAIAAGLPPGVVEKAMR